MDRPVSGSATPIVLIGGGGHCMSVIDTLMRAGRPIKGILDKSPRDSHQLLGVPFIGTDDDIPVHVADSEFLVTVGQIKSPAKRIDLHRLVEAAGGRFATVVAPSASVSAFASLGPGTVVLAQAAINAGASIGCGCIINTGAIVDHNATIGSFTHISTGAIVNGDCRVGDRVFIGSGAVIANGVTVADDVIIGAGAVVVSDITSPGTYFGNPAHRHE